MTKVISQQSLEHFMNEKHNFSMKQKKNLNLCLRRWYIFEELLLAEVTFQIPITGSWLNYFGDIQKSACVNDEIYLAKHMGQWKSVAQQKSKHGGLGT